MILICWGLVQALVAGGQRMAQLLRARVSDYDADTATLRPWDGKGKRATPREHLLLLAPKAVEMVSSLLARAKVREQARRQGKRSSAGPGRAARQGMATETNMNIAFDSIKRGLLEAIEHAEGRAPQTRIHRPRPVDVKALRAKVGMTQEQFAARFGFSMATLRHWERGDRTPHGPALVLLNVIERNPAAVIEALTE